LQILHLLYQTQRENCALYFDDEKSWGTPQHRGTEETELLKIARIAKIAEIAKIEKRREFSSR
jgi:hypothetical protein